MPPKGAPNVLLIMTDDQGYGVSGTFGGVIATPALDRVANTGLRYTQYHSTSLCSPTRAALITGRKPSRRGLRRDHRVVHGLPALRFNHRSGERHDWRGVRRLGFRRNPAPTFSALHQNLACKVSPRSLSILKSPSDDLKSEMPWKSLHLAVI